MPRGRVFMNLYLIITCNPTRSSMLTGLYKGSDGALHIAQLTNEAGYFNIISGKEHSIGYLTIVKRRMCLTIPSTTEPQLSVFVRLQESMRDLFILKVES